MNDSFDDASGSFIFSDPSGNRWPRLRLILLFSGVLLFFATLLFVQTLFVAPQFNLRQLKGQLKSLQKVNPAGQLPTNVPLWEKFGAARLAAKKQPSPPLSVPARPRKKSPEAEVRLGFYIDQWADAAKAFGKPIIVVLANEMNGD